MVRLIRWHRGRNNRGNIMMVKDGVYDMDKFDVKVDDETLRIWLECGACEEVTEQEIATERKEKVDAEKAQADAKAKVLAEAEVAKKAEDEPPKTEEVKPETVPVEPDEVSTEDDKVRKLEDEDETDKAEDTEATKPDEPETTRIDVNSYSVD